MSATWDQPDFGDPRFSIVRVNEALTCRREGCDRLAEHLVEYTMRRGGWTYEYGCGYCDEHTPPEVRQRISRSEATDSGRYDLDAEGYDPEWACTHCNGEGLCWDGADPLGDCPDELHACHACYGSGKREDQRVF